LRRSIRKYFSDTNTLLYSYLISLPLLLLYEILINISQPNTGAVVRISVDIWIRTLFSYFSTHILSITLIVVAVLGLAILYFERRKLHTLKARYFFYMLGEAICYAFILALSLGSIISLLFHIVTPDGIVQLSTLQKVALSLGAGLYEELFFRVMLVSGLVYVFRCFTRKKTAFIWAVVTAALIFSAVHYVGPIGDNFTASSFLFRFLFGVALNILY